MSGFAVAESYEYCRDLVRKADKDRFLSILFAPAERRDHLYALHAFNSEVAQVRDKVSDALPGEVRLQWWCEALAGCGHGEVLRNPVAAALLDTLERTGLPAEPLIDLVEARSFDLYEEPMATMNDLRGYIATTSALPFQISASILEVPDCPPLRTATREGGIAYGIVGLLRGLGHHAARGKCYLPEELLARHGVPPHDLLAGRSTPALQAALGELRSVARQHLELAFRTMAEVPAIATPAILPLALARPYLDRMEKAGTDVFSDCTIAQWRRQWILWRAACRGMV